MNACTVAARSAADLTGPSLERIKADIAYSNANVKPIGISSGMACGEFGRTHHSIEDFAWTRVLPNLPVTAPCDSIETVTVEEWAANYEGRSSYICRASAFRTSCRSATSMSWAKRTCCATAMPWWP